MQIFVIEIDDFNNSNEHNFINFEDRVIVSLKQSQNISISSKHEQRMTQNEIVICINCNAEKLVDLTNIFNDDSIEKTNDDANDFWYVREFSFKLNLN